jgi:N-acetylmuramoyl-L-alanine amidase
VGVCAIFPEDLFFTVRLHYLAFVFSALAVITVLLYVRVTGAQIRTKALSGWLIAVDAGHGGHDKGAWFPQQGLVEKDVNLAVAKELGQVLHDVSAAVILTRHGDTFVDLSERARMANAADAQLFVSIHVNRFPADPSCCGAQVFYADSPASKQLGIMVQAQLIAIDPQNRRKALPGDYKVLRDTRMPAILVEIGFATNARDRTLIMNPRYRQDVAKAIRDGIIEFSQWSTAARIPKNAADR